MRDILRVNKMLNFRQSKLAHANQGIARRDLIAEGRADLGAGKGEPAVVELK